MRHPSRRAVLAGATAFLASGAAAAPDAALLSDRWTKTGSGGDPDYGVWGDFLSVYVKPRPGAPTLVDYQGALSDGASAALGEWLAATQRIDPATLTKPAQRAWWTNLYNAATVDLVLRYYPVRSIRVIEGGFFNLGPWDEDILQVNGVRLSLNDVEHGVLRPVWRDPRTHYAVNCASIGCPDLSPEPWRAGDLEARLDEAARRYINDPRGVRIEDGKLIVSSIFSWFAEDFGGTDANVIAHLRRYAEPPLLAALEGRTKIDDHAYDWSLNATPAGQG